MRRHSGPGGPVAVYGDLVGLPAPHYEEVGLARIPASLRLVPRALLFDGDAYHEIKGRPRALGDGALLLLALGAGLGLAGAARGILAWGAAPEAEALARTLERGVGGLPALRGFGPLAGAWLARLVRLRRALSAPLLAVGAPVWLLLDWLAYGQVAHRAARRLGGQGALRATLACTALAEAPRALLLVPALPAVSAAALGVEAWVLAARFQALRAAHGLEGWRTFWAALAAEFVLVAVTAGLLVLAAWRVG